MRRQERGFKLCSSQLPHGRGTGIAAKLQEEPGWGAQDSASNKSMVWCV